MVPDVLTIFRNISLTIFSEAFHVFKSSIPESRAGKKITNDIGNLRDTRLNI